MYTWKASLKVCFMTWNVSEIEVMVVVIPLNLSLVLKVVTKQMGVKILLVHTVKFLEYYLDIKLLFRKVPGLRLCAAFFPSNWAFGGPQNWSQFSISGFLWWAGLHWTRLFWTCPRTDLYPREAKSCIPRRVLWSQRVQRCRSGSYLQGWGTSVSKAT